MAQCAGVRAPLNWLCLADLPASSPTFFERSSSPRCAPFESIVLHTNAQDQHRTVRKRPPCGETVHALTDARLAADRGGCHEIRSNRRTHGRTARRAPQAAHIQASYSDIQAPGDCGNGYLGRCARVPAAYGLLLHRAYLRPKDRSGAIVRRVRAEPSEPPRRARIRHIRLFNALQKKSDATLELWTRLPKRAGRYHLKSLAFAIEHAARSSAPGADGIERERVEILHLPTASVPRRVPGMDSR